MMAHWQALPPHVLTIPQGVVGADMAKGRRRLFIRPPPDQTTLVNVSLHLEHPFC